jgi:hypothetical protein
MRILLFIVEMEQITSLPLLASHFRAIIMSDSCFFDVTFMTVPDSCFQSWCFRAIAPYLRSTRNKYSVT